MPEQGQTNIPRGFRFAGIHCGIKASAPDLSLIASEHPCAAGGVYTQNLVRAACIDWNRSLTPSASARAVVINSGNANACTGKRGVADTEEMARLTAGELGSGSQAVDPRSVFVLSTGVIGRPMPMERIRAGIRTAAGRLEATPAAFEAAAEAIRTTDRSRKTMTGRFEAGGQTYSIAAMAKGAGMIGPGMATMLALLVTDFPLEVAGVQSAIRQAADLSFNRISVEGHTSTNDAAILLAPLANRPPEAEGLERFRSELERICLQLARMIPTDGEGATHLIHVLVRGAADDAAADRIARTIALSNLVKTAVAGADPNWGRIVSAAGYAGVSFDPQDLRLVINGICLFDRGEPTPFDAGRTSAAIREQRETAIELDVGPGPGVASHFSSDLTADYVRLNAEYTT